MTVLIDFSQIAFSSWFINNTTIDSINFWKYMVLNQIRKILMTVHPDEVILCCDYKSWRKDVFLLYKHSRKAKTGDMKELYAYMDSFISEVKDIFPYKVVKVEKAEGDDVMAILSAELKKNVMIVSGDKDIQQLVRPGIQLWVNSPYADKVLTENNPEQLEELYIYGDTTDGVPNILSPDDIFTQEGKRQKSITKKLLLEIHNSGGVEHWIENQPNEIQKNFERNKKLISLSLENIPFEIKKKVLEEYYTDDLIDRNYGQLIYNYFNEKEMYSFNESVNDFLLGGQTFEAPFVEVPTGVPDEKDLSGLFE